MTTTRILGRIICLVAAILCLTKTLSGSTRVPLQDRETMLANIRATFSNDGSVGYGFSRARHGGIWPHGGVTSYFDIGGLWISCRKRVQGTMQDVCLVGVDPRTRKRSFTPGSIIDNKAATDSVLLERSQIYSSAFVETPDFDPLLTHVWPVRNINGVRTVILDARERGKHPRFERSDEDLFALYSDADALRIEQPGVGLPLGIDVEQDAYTWFTDSLSNVVILEYTITNRSADTLVTPTVAGVFSVAIGDTSLRDAGLSTRVNITGKDSNAYLTGANPTAGGSGVIAFFGIDHDVAYHSWSTDSAPNGATSRRTVLASATHVDSTTPYPVAVIARNSADLLPGKSFAIRCAFAVAPNRPTLDALVHTTREAAKINYSGRRVSSYAIIDAEVLDSLTSVGVAHANINVHDVDEGYSFDVLTDYAGSARLRVMRNHQYDVTATARDFAPSTQRIRTFDSMVVVPLLLAHYESKALLPTSPAPLQLGAFSASARIVFSKHAAARAGHKLQIVTEGLLTGNALSNPVTIIPYHVIDATTKELLLRDTLTTNLRPCGDFPDSVSVVRTALVDSAVEITVSMRGLQDINPVALSTFRYVKGTSDATLTPIGSDDHPNGFSCAHAASGTGAYNITFSPGGETLVRLGSYVINMPYLDVHVIQGGTSILTRGDRADTANAGLWTMRVAAWKKHAGTFLGYPCLDHDPSQCEYFGRYYPALSLEPLEHDTIVFAHCLTLNGNRFGIDYSNRGIPSVAHWPHNAMEPTHEIDTGTTIGIGFSGGMTADFPFDSAIVSFQLPDHIVSVERINYPAPFKLYPDPAMQQVHVQLPVSGAISIRICDMLGRILMNERSVASASADLDLTQLSPGMYQLIVHSANGDHRRTLVIIR